MEGVEEAAPTALEPVVVEEEVVEEEEEGRVVVAWLPFLLTCVLPVFHFFTRRQGRRMGR